MARLAAKEGVQVSARRVGLVVLTVGTVATAKVPMIMRMDKICTQEVETSLNREGA